jgi:EmrB/QacA subfamily drug resistance transporter
LFGFEGENAREKGIVLLTMCFALAMAMLDNTVVNVALPTIEKNLHASFAGLQWVVDGYVIMFASLLLTGGTLGDRFGRKKTFLGGLTLFTIASLLCGISASTGQLVACRALQGIGGALMIPGTLSIITVTFPPHERAKALGIWAGVSGIALALGPTLGGYMVQHLGWESVFFLNVPVGIAAFIVARSTVTESRSDEARRVDVVGLILGTSALVSVTYGLIEANAKGWTNPVILGSLAACVVLMTTFLLWEMRTDHAMMPLRFFRIPSFSAGNYVAFSVSLGMFATFFYLTLYMQNIHGYSPTTAGAGFLPMTLMIIVTAPNAGKYASKHGSRVPMTYGLTLAGTGLLLLGLFLKVDSSYLFLAPLFLIMGHGMGATMAPMTAAVMNSVGPQRAGLGSAMTNTSREVGGVLGIALLGAILAAKVGSTLVPALARIGVTGQTAIKIADAAKQGGIALKGLTATQQGQVVAAYKQSFMDGFRPAMVFGAGAMLVAAIIANRFIPGRETVREAEAAAHQGEAVPAH